MALREPVLVWTYRIESLDEKEAVCGLAAARSLSSTAEGKAHRLGCSQEARHALRVVVLSVKQDTATGQENPAWKSS